MSALSSFNAAPYFDDFSEDKKFYKILFRPGVSVQARELTQLQTILQKQIQRHGDNIFKDGAMVIPGQVSVNTSYNYVKIQQTYNGVLAASYSDQLVGKVLVGSITGIRAEVRKVVHTDGVDPETIFVNYLSSGTNNLTKVFINNENLIPEDVTFASLGLQVAATAATGIGSAASIERGVYYVGGYFVLALAQTIILDKYSNTPSYRVGLNIINSIVDSEDDESLLDNALGSYNYSAPGAHRQTIDLILDKRAVGSVDDANFIQLVQTVGGVVAQKLVKTDYNILENTLARRTYDESGDFTVRPFAIDVREHRNNDRGVWKSNTAYLVGDIVLSGGNFYTNNTAGSSSTTAPSHTTGTATDGTVVWAYTVQPAFNRGIYSPENGGDASQLAIGLEPGKAYVRGFEIEKVATGYLAVPKARDTLFASNIKVNALVGNYALVKNINGLPRIDQLSTVILTDSLTASVGTQSGSQIGTARVRGFEYDSGTIGTQNAVYKLELFDVKLNSGKDFAKDVKQFYINNGSTITNFSADISPNYIQKVGSVTSAGTTTVTGTGTLFLSDIRVGDYVRLGASNTRKVTAIASNISLTVDAAVTVTGEVYTVLTGGIIEPNNSPLFFRMPQYAIKSVRSSDGSIGTTYTVMQRFTATANGAGSLTVAVSGGNDTFASEAVLANYSAVDNTTGAIVSPTSITRNSPLNTQVTFVFGAGFASRSFSVIAAVNKTGAGTEKTKTLTTGLTNVTTSATATAKIIPLAVADAYLVNSVFMDAGGFAAPSGNYTIDITARYSFSDGQTDSFYGPSTISLIDGSPVPSGPIQIKFQYFAHSATGDYFSVNSYTSTIAYDQIPSFSGIQLRDCIDFRPRIDNQGLDFVSAGSVVNGVPKRGIDVQADFTYYLARKDKLALATDGTFFDVTGVSSIIPVEPNDPTTGMVLFKITLEPYTFGANNNSVRVETIDNKRYTMRDIGRIDKRVDNLEYYTSLSMLEQETKSLAIPDANGLQRFKNGFIVDSFKGQGIGDASSNDYQCSIDMEKNILRPIFAMSNVTLFEQNTTDTQRAAAGYQVTGDIITLPYTSVKMIEQPYASRTENVNPFAVFTFIGRADLNPSSDEWFDTARRPDIINNVEGNFNAVSFIAEQTGALNTVWNSWQTQWSGTPVVTSSSTMNFGVHTNTVWDNGVLRARVGSEITNMARNITLQTDATTVGLARTGISSQVVAKVTTDVTGDRIVSSATIPYMRARNVLFVVRGLKPATQFYPFFDGTAIAAQCTPATKIAYTAINGFGNKFDYTSTVGGLADEPARMVSGNSDNSLDRGDVVFVLQRGATVYTVATSPATAIVGLQEISGAGNLSLETVNVRGTFLAGDIITGSVTGARGTITGSVTVGQAGGALVSNAAGDVVGLFAIPSTDALRFRTGTREFKLSDDANNATTATSSSSAQYSAKGVLQTKQATLTSTRNAEIIQTQVSQNKTVVVSQQRVVSDSGWYDPLAQTFLVQQTDGAFITEIDLFFQDKDASIPVQVQIRDVVNGYPGKNILPFSHTILTPDQVNVSDTGLVPTTFKMKSPVYVGDASEYCIVVLSDSAKYKIWISQLGDQVIGSDRFISDQPYSGVLFKSQNASTWTADQLQDMKFTIRRAQFVTGQYGEVNFVNDQITLTPLQKNPFQTTNGSTLVRVDHRDHGLSTGSTVVLSGSTLAVNGVPAANLNGSFVVSNVDIDCYTITVATAATSTGLGGGSTINALGNAQFDTFQPIVQIQNFTDTQSQFFVKTTSGQTPEGTEIAYVLDSTFIAVAINDTNYLSRTAVVASKTNENLSMASSKSFVLKGRLFSTNDAVSPFIDTHRLSLITVKNRITVPTPANTNVPVVDDRIVVSASTGISFSGSQIVFANAGDKLAVKTINIGRIINIAGSASNNGDYLVTDVATDGSTITVNAYTFITAGAGASITLVSRENYVDEIAPLNSSSVSKYVTRRVNLANASTYLKIRMSANIPPQANVLVYYKLNPVGGAVPFETIRYIAVTPDSPFVKSNTGTFYDTEFSLTGLIPFDAVQIKIVMQSTNSAAVPLIKDLRVIACA
jgi:hypothetical protein